MKKIIRKTALTALQIIFALCLVTLTACSSSCASCSGKNINPDMPDNASTTRAPAPTDGSKPTDHTPLENTAYMAYVLDNAEFYHSYAHNSTKSTGYEQVTQTWKDYKNAELSGKNAGIMVCSDVSYSALVKSASQSCFVGSGSAYMRNGAKPSKNSTATTVDWSNGQPAYYSKDDYLKKYGEFSTELTVYAINSETTESFGEVTDNGDGTYSQTMTLNSDAACWYQYGMKTRGGLKTYPEFEKIAITFKFDAQWRILETYCEEKAKIAPAALGGIAMGSTSKTTTVFDYTEQGFDNAHYAYFTDYFDKYVGEILDGEEDTDNEPEFLDVLMGGFSKALSAQGQQFDLELTLGGKQYDGKVYISIDNLDVSTLGIKFALGAKDSGKQDLFVEYSGGKIDAYYGDGFAITAELDKVVSSVKDFSDWINSTFGQGEPSAQSGEAGTGLNLEDLLALIGEGFGYDETSAWIAVKSDNLLNLGIGIDLRIDFSREITEEGNKFEFTKLSLSSLSYEGGKFDIQADAAPSEDGEVISRNPAETYADIAEYITGVKNLVSGGNYSVNVKFDGTVTDIDYIKNAKLEANAIVSLSEDFKNLSVGVPVTVDYAGLTVKLNAYYTVGFNGGGYGKIYLRLTEIGGKAVDAKVYCDIEETVSAVTRLIDYFKNTPGVRTADEGVEEGASSAVAELVNKVLSLDFGAIIKELRASSEKIEIGIGADEALGALGVDLGIDIGTVNLSLALSGSAVSLEGGAPSLGLTLGVSASASAVTVPDTENYADVTKYVNGVYNLLNSPVYRIGLTFINSGLEINASALLKTENNFGDITVYAPINVSYGGIEVSLTAHYSISLADKNYGEVYLCVETLNGNPVGARVYCDISDTVETVKEIIAMFKPAEEGGSDTSASALNSTDTVAEIIGKVVALDYTALIKQLKADKTGIDIAVDADYLLGEIGVALGNNIKLGTLAFNVTLDENEAVALVAKLPDFGVELTVCGEDRAMPTPDKTQYLDICEVLELVKRASKEALAIKNGEQVIFALDTALTVDGIKMSVAGGGQVSWKNNKLRVAFGADLSVYEGEAGETLAVNFVYDEDNTDADGNEILPLAKFTVNNLGMEIYRRDIDGLGAGLNEIIDSVKRIANAFTPSANTGAQALSAVDGREAEQSGFAKLLDMIFGEIGKFTVELVEAEEEGGLASLVITYAQSGTLKLDVNGGINLDLAISDGASTEILSLSAGVRGAAEGDDKFAELNGVFENSENGYVFYSAENSGDFTKALYDYITDLFESLTVKNLLGSDTYTVNIILDGAKSGIDALGGVYVSAEARYTEDADGKKLMELDALMNINGTDVNFSAVCYDGRIYVTVYNVGGTHLSNNGVEQADGTIVYSDGLKITADGGDIYKAAEAVVKIIKNKNLSAIIDMLAPAGGTSAPSQNEGGVIPDEKTEFAVTDIINALLTLDLSFGKSEDGTLNTLTLNIDKALSQFGLGFEIGTVTVSVNPKTHDIYASAVKAEEWLSLSAKAVENEQPVTFDKEGYLDISFVSGLANDINNTLDSIESADGKPDVRLSFRGEITIPVQISGLKLSSIDFKDATVTAGLDADGDFFFTLKAQIQSAALAINATRYISVTYSDGYITFGRDVDKASAIYKVMTLDYLLDNMLVKGNDAPLRWWLDFNSTTWGIVCGALKVDISSNLTKTDEYYVFDPSQNSEEEEPAEKRFALSDYLNALIVNGMTVYGECSDFASTLGLGADDGYYGLALNSAKLLGKDFPTLYAAILRDDSIGIKGLSAYMNVANALYPKIKLTDRTYTHAPNYFKTVTSAHKDIKFDYSANSGRYTEIFGCYNTENSSTQYSKKYSDVRLTVLDGEGNVTAEKTLKYGSKIYVVEQITENADGSKNIYVDGNGNDVTSVRFTKTNDAGEETVIGYGFYLEADTVIRPYVSAPGAIEYWYNGEKCQEDGHLFAGQPLTECAKTVEGKTFAGWYLEPELISYVTSAQAGYGSYYAKFVDTVQTAENGVQYTFSRDITLAQGGSFCATGFDKESADKDYSDLNATLVIPDTFAGYPVTGIGAGAFYGKGVNFKNVLVSESVTSVGAEAFRDNKGMQTAVFLADVVTFGGSSYKNDGNRFAFLGCAREGNDNITDLCVYYNKISESTDSNWSGYQNSSSLFNDKGNNIPSGQLFEAGKWAYAEYAVSGYETLSCLRSGIVTSAQTAEELCGAILAELDALSSADGYIGQYSVNVSRGIELDGTRYPVEVVITLKDRAEWLYEITASGSFEGEEKPVTVSGEVTLYENRYFAGVGARIELRPASGLEFANLTADENGAHVFEMQAEKVNVQAEYKKKAIDRITLISEIAFMYGESSTALNEYGVSVDAAGETVLSDVGAEGYFFLGWAYDAHNNGNLVFTDGTFTAETVKSDVYYAIWAVNRDDGVTFVNNTQSGDSIASVSVAEEGKGTFYSWYAKDDTEFAGETVETPTLGNTVLRARLQYSLTVNVNGTKCRGAYIGDKKSESTFSNNNSVSETYTVYEKERIYVKNTSANKKDYYVGRVNNGVKEDISGQINIKVTSGFSTKAAEISAKYNDELIGLTNEDDGSAYSYFNVDGNYTFVFAN